jgi:tight adherence protein B
MPGQTFAALISVLVFACVALAAFGIASLVSERAAGLKRLERFSKPKAEPNIEVPGGRGGDSERRKHSANELVLSVLKTFGKAFEGKEYASKIERELAKANIPLRGSEFVGLNLILVVLGAAYGWFVLGHALAGLVLASLGGLLPNLYVKARQGSRLAKFDSQIADALVIMSNSLRAGYSFLQAMDMVAKEMSPPISEEFTSAMKEMSLGSPTESALAALSDRVGSEDLELVVTAVLIQRQIGGNLAEVLDNIAETIRERVKLRQEVKTLTAQGRMSGVIIGVLPAALGVFLYAVNPEYISLLFTHPTGKLMVGLAVFGELIGILVIRKIVAIEI